MEPRHPKRPLRLAIAALAILITAMGVGLVQSIQGPARVAEMRQRVFCEQIGPAYIARKLETYSWSPGGSPKPRQA